MRISGINRTREKFAKPERLETGDDDRAPKSQTRTSNKSKVPKLHCNDARLARIRRGPSNHRNEVANN